jgi:hypothetical protein
MLNLTMNGFEPFPAREQLNIRLVWWLILSSQRLTNELSIFRNIELLLADWCSFSANPGLFMRRFFVLYSCLPCKRSPSFHLAETESSAVKMIGFLATRDSLAVSLTASKESLSFFHLTVKLISQQNGTPTTFQ